MEDTVDRERWEKDNERINWRIVAQMEKSIGEKNEEEKNHREAAYEDQDAQGLKSDDDEKEKEKEHKSENNIAEEQTPQEEMETGSLSNSGVENVQRNKRKMEDEEDQTELTVRVQKRHYGKKGTR